IGLASILAACGVKGSEGSSAGPGASDEGSAAWWADQKSKAPGQNVNFTNWPQYIDIQKVNGVRTYPTLEAFTKKTGINVTYRADINKHDEVYASIRADVENGNDTGSDIIVITNGTVLAEMIDLGYLIQLDPELMPNFKANAGDTVTDPSYDPNNAHTM